MNEEIRQQFSILHQEVNDEPLIYLDNAATTQKPDCVLAEMMRFYEADNANIHRGVHTLAERSTKQYEAARESVAQFIGAKSHEILFNSGTTSGINFVARGLIEPLLSKGDQIMTTYLEHHSNLVPWQEVARRQQCDLIFAPLTANYQVDIEALSKFDASRLKVIAIQHISNVIGVEQPIADITVWAKQRGILVVVDGAQAVAHLPVNVSTLEVDAYCFSGHKLYGPTGVGVCYLNEQWHAQCQPVNFGGEMIHYVGDTESTYKQAPWKFEAGTPPIAQVIGLKKAIEWVNAIGLQSIASHEVALIKYLVTELERMQGVTVYGCGNGIVSFNIDYVHPHDAATAYDMEGIALRAGHHCAQPLMRQLNVMATLRVSVAVYNTRAEVEQFIRSTQRIKEFFSNGIG